MRRRPNAAFTLIEVLVVIGIMAVLVTLVTFGIRSIGNTTRAKSTRVTMENLKSLVTEKEVSGGTQALNEVYPVDRVVNGANVYVVKAPLKFPKEFGKDSDRFPKFNTNPPTATAYTQGVIALLKAVPNNAKWMESLPSNQMWMPKIPSEVPAGSPRVPLILDAWGNPIIYVPPGGLDGVTVSGDVKSRIADTLGPPASPQATVQSPDLKAFWASAGPDGYFTDPDPSKPLDQREPYGDDNVYSFEP